MAVNKEELERLKKRLSLYYEAEEQVLAGQEYKIGSRSLRKADLSEITDMIKTLKKEISYLEKGGKNKVLRGVPLDI